MRRVSVVGSSGSGKTTFAAELAALLGVPHVELDAINWGPDWSPLDVDTFRTRVREATDGDGWVCDGNYSAVRPIVLERADTVVWLDLPLRVCLARVMGRTIRRIRDRDELWSGNRETWRSLIGGDSLAWWLISQHRRKRRDYAARFDGPEAQHLRILTFRTSTEADRWLAELRAEAGN
jgi:adenylate kinase family enzyme